MENISKELRKKVVECNAKRLTKYGITPVSQKLSEYKRKTDGKVVKSVLVEYDNGWVSEVTENRFWAKRD